MKQIKTASAGIACNGFRRFHMVNLAGQCVDCGAMLPTVYHFVDRLEWHVWDSEHCDFELLRNFCIYRTAAKRVKRNIENAVNNGWHSDPTAIY